MPPQLALVCKQLRMRISLRKSGRHLEEKVMLDAAYIAAAIVFFVICWEFAKACERM